MLIDAGAHLVSPLNQEFEQIFREHQHLVYRTSYRVTGNSEDAEDVLQSVFMSLLRREFAPDFASVKSYLYRAAVNASLDIVRSRRRRKFVGETELLEGARSSDGADVEEEKLALLREALIDLHPRSAEILILHYVHGYTDKDIAKLLGTSRGTIAVSLFRSRARLRRRVVAAFAEKHAGERI